MLHDACPRSDGGDAEHGARAAILATTIRPPHIHLDDEGFELLSEACYHHTRCRHHRDIAVRTRWDADRLDLGRVGIVPDPRHVCTEFARQPEVIDWAYRRSLSGRGGPRGHRRRRGGRRRS
jgi:uncharacterized protein